MKKIILKVNGMMCVNCENRVKNVLKNIDEVENVFANHITGEVTIMAKDNLSSGNINKTLEDIGYEVVGEQ